MFIKNFKKSESQASEATIKAGPKVWEWRWLEICVFVRYRYCSFL